MLGLQLFLVFGLAIDNQAVSELNRDFTELMAWFLDSSNTDGRTDAKAVREVVMAAVGDKAKDANFGKKVTAWCLNKLNLEQHDYDVLEQNGFAERLGGFFKWLAKGKRFGGIPEQAKVPAILEYVFAENAEMAKEQENSDSRLRRRHRRRHI